MDNIKLIYENIKAVKLDIKKRPIKIEINRKSVDSEVLFYIVSRFKYLLTYKFLDLPIVINFNSSEFADKITYLILDALIYDLLRCTRFKIRVNFNKQLNNNIHNSGFSCTALYRVLNSGKNTNFINRELFLKIYTQPFYVDENTYRRLLTRHTLQINETPSIICSEVASILKVYSEDEEWIDTISEVVSELICNVSSHTIGDCLLDINFSNTIEDKRDNQDEKYTLVNIAVINFSDNRLFDRIKSNIEQQKYAKDDLLYSRIYQAYDKHKKFFDESYTKDDFFLVTAFQNHVTSRTYKSGKGGTGLTRLIQNIIGKSKNDYSYVLSGENVLIFQSEYLNISKDKFIGFNKENDYFNFRPSKEVINMSRLYVPGTIYHLLLIKEK